MPARRATGPSWKAKAACTRSAANQPPTTATLLAMTSTAPADTLRHLFVLMIGLAMRESSGKCWEGRDTTATNTSADTAEAGLFQTSWNIKTASPNIPPLLSDYWTNPNGFLPAFGEKIEPTASNLQNAGSGQGTAYQWLAKYCPAFAAMVTALGLRTRRSHWGPIGRREVEIVDDADKFLKQVVVLLRDTPIAPTPPPVPVPPLPAGAVVSIDISVKGDAKVYINGKLFAP